MRGADAVDCALGGMECYECNNPQLIYCKSDEDIVAHFEDIRRCAEEIGIEICHTHGRFEGF